MTTHTQNPIKRLWNYATTWQSSMITASIYSVLNKVFDVFPEILIGIAIDVVIKKQESFLAQCGIVDATHQLGVLAGLTFIVWGLESLTEYQAITRWRHLAQLVQHSLRMDGVHHCQNLSISWFEDKNSGTLLSILSEDVNQVERFLNEGVHHIIQLLVSSLLISAVFFYISPSVAFWAVLPIPIIIMGGFRFRSKLSERYSAVRSSAGVLGSKLSALLTGTLTIRACGAEREQAAQVDAQSMDYNLKNQAAIKLSSAFVPIIRMAVLAGFLFTLVLGGLQTLEGSLSAAAYTVLVFLTQRLLWPFTRFGEIIDLYERSLASTQRVMDLLATTPDHLTPKNPAVFKGLHDAIRFQNIHFGYQGRPALLQDLSLEIKAGSFCAFVGATGAGKSTITKLLLSFYQPQKGQVLLDQTPLSATDPRQIRQHIGYVGQDVFLLDGTIADNLMLGAPTTTHEQMIQAAKQAFAHDFIMQLPGGYDCPIGERGQKLSGGQKQRLAIARALLRRPQIFIFDEATSAVDNETEAAIQRSIEGLIQQGQEQNITLIVIAHRLSTIRRADVIHVLDQGQVVQSGTHNQLAETPGIYQKLWQIQTGS